MQVQLLPLSFIVHKKKDDDSPLGIHLEPRSIAGEGKYKGVCLLVWESLWTFIITMKDKIKTPHAETIEEAIDNIEGFFEVDMWYAQHAEWKKEEDMLKYLKSHFNVLRKEIKRIRRRKK